MVRVRRQSPAPNERDHQSEDTTMLRRKLTAAVLATVTVATLAWAPAAKAEVLLFTATTTPQAIQPATSDWVKFGGNPPAVAFAVSTTQPNTPLIIIFDAVCSTDGDAST